VTIGILNPLYTAVAWVIKQLYNLLGPVFGNASGITWVLSIVILVVLMRLIMVPLFIKQMHTTRAMTALTPKMTELRKKYKGDRQKLNEETMKLYQEAGVNPLMGCLPVVLQLPIFFALFTVLRAIASKHTEFGLTKSMLQNASQAKIFGATVASKFLNPIPGETTAAKVVIVVTVLLSMATTYLTMRQSVKRGMMPAAGSDNPMGQSQRIMTYVMPLFALSGLYWPFGLVLYWVTTNVWTLGQQYFLLRKYPVGLAVLPAGPGGASGPAGGPPSGPRRPARPGGSGPAGPAKGPRGGGSDGAAAKDVKGDSGLADGKAAANGAAPAAAKPPQRPKIRSGSSGTNGAGGLLRRFSKPAAEPAPPEQPPARLVRQQRTRQPRSKRSGKR
jgi:YidC/Oxa1 family membrane protein insertase